MLHELPHENAGQTVVLTGAVKDASGELAEGLSFQVDDWWDRVAGVSWMHAEGNPAALKYAMRAGIGGLPMDNNVVYGKVNGLGHIVHVDELDAAAGEQSDRVSA